MSPHPIHLSATREQEHHPLFSAVETRLREGAWGYPGTHSQHVAEPDLLLEAGRGGGAVPGSGYVEGNLSP